MKLWIEKWQKKLGIKVNQTGHVEKWLSGIGGLVSILAVIMVSRIFADMYKIDDLVVASMGATAVLLFAVPHGPLSQPWPVIGGHTLSAIVGVASALWIPDMLLAAAVAVALAIGLMHYLRCLHPPGGATALTAVVGGERFHSLGFHYVVTPVLLGAITMVITAVLFNYFFSWRRYPAVLATKGKSRKQSDAESTDASDRITRHDMEKALKSMNRVIDISGHDLEEIYRMAKLHAQSTGIEPMNLELGQYYSNGHFGPNWQVRQIIDMAKMKSTTDKVIYKVVAGKNLYTTGIASGDDFSHWARYEVFQEGEKWLRLENSDYALEQA